MGYIVGIDIGGTFTDAVAVDTATGAVHTAKSRTTPADLADGVMEALGLLSAQAGRSIAELLAETEKFAHGTTQTSNAVVEWSGARTGLLTTRGFADEILMMRARGRVAGLGLSDRRHFRTTEKPNQVVPKPLIVEVSERVDHHGRAVVPLTEEEAQRTVGALLERDVEAVAVSLLWAHVNPAHELLLERVLRERAPNVYVSLGHRLAAVPGEYERTATAAIDAYVGPTMRRYLSGLADQLRGSGLRRPLLVLQASGGVVQADATVPVNTIESGPAAGLVATRMLATAAGYPNVIATDVGGTTFKVGLLLEGQWSFARETIINQYTILLPAIDLVSIGAGGGSIAWVDESRLRVGPRSAGADPGPACYGWGGVEPTVTDADTVLGFLHPDRFLGGRLRLDLERARTAIHDRVARPLFDGDTEHAAAGIRRVVDAQMGDLVRKVTIERGYDPRTFVLMAYGGAGPLHAVDYARGIGVREIVVPTAATVYSAFGAAASDIHHSLVRSVPSAFPENIPQIRPSFDSMAAEARELLARQGIEADRMVLGRWADMRYDRQLENVRVPIPDGDEDFEALMRAAFERRYQALYGEGAILPGAPLRVLRLGLEATGLVDKPSLPTREPGPADASGAEREPRSIYWPSVGERLRSRVWDGLQLHPGNRLQSPGVVELPGTTIALPPGVEAEIDRFGNTVITLSEG